MHFACSDDLMRETKDLSNAGGEAVLDENTGEMQRTNHVEVYCCDF